MAMERLIDCTTVTHADTIHFAQALKSEVELYTWGLNILERTASPLATSKFEYQAYRHFHLVDSTVQGPIIMNLSQAKAVGVMQEVIQKLRARKALNGPADAMAMVTKGYPGKQKTVQTQLREGHYKEKVETKEPETDVFDDDEEEEKPKKQPVKRGRNEPAKRAKSPEPAVALAVTGAPNPFDLCPVRRNVCWCVPDLHSGH